MRRRLTVGMVVVGLALMVLGYFVLSAPWGSSNVDHSNPQMDFSGLIFILGVLLAFSAAIVYEVLPARDDDR